MKSCLENYITLDPDSTPRSGLRVTNLPGVSINQFEALLNDEADLAEYWEKFYKRIKESFLIQITHRVNRNFKVDSITYVETSGKFNSDLIINDTTGQAGVKIEIKKSKYTVLEIATILIHSVTPISDAVIVIRNNETEEILKTIQKDLVEGLNTIDVYEDFNVESVSVTYDSEQVQSIETENITYKRGCCNVCSKGVEQINGGGLIVNFNSKCSIEAFTCSRLSIFKWPFLYWMGIELMTERLTSENTNCFTIDTKEAERLLQVYEAEFEKSFPINLNIKDDQYCFDCRGAVTKKVLLP